MTNPDDNDESHWAFWEVTASGDPGHLGEDEPEVRPLCRKCTKELPDGDDGLCAFCRLVDGSSS
ncbi:hypothetical protein [Mycobacterium sp. DL592]|uniref:hypothetical protein n=1 Tax=Mycobacterium sp. DL592 TaxID=2675524 RepID=UPI001421F7EC|nr:hypothetical protein [Mycobacterium sp. DL592]